MPSLVIPSLADLPQHIAGPVPMDLVRRWSESAQDDATEEALLEPYARTGTIVCSDSAGLSKLSAARPLIEVMKLVNEPKEVIFGYGRALGGTPVGVWAADNTQMFYPADVPVERIVAAMAAAQREIRSLTVQVGIGIHRACVFDINGWLYGAEADSIEDFTEDETHGGELVVSKTVRDTLKDVQILEEREGMYVLDHASLGADATRSDEFRYPIPFDPAFHDALRALDPADRVQVQALADRFVQQKTVVLLRTFFPAGQRLLDACVARVRANAIVNAVLADDADRCLVKANGTLAIIASDDVAHACDLAKRLLEAMQEQGFTSNAGVVQGDVLLFRLKAGGRDIAGSPVNVASKLAEDTEDRNALFFETSVADAARALGFSAPFELTRSSVTIRGVRT